MNPECIFATPVWRFLSRKIPAAIIVSVFLTIAGCGLGSGPQVTVYCALDREFSEPILKEFSKRHGIRVLPKYDTEANKSVGLFQDLLRESSRPRCDVHWNNEILATIRLQNRDILQSYKSEPAKSYPKAFRSNDHSWHAFAARARIILVNTSLVSEKNMPSSLWDLTDPRLRDKIAMAKPQFGTTASHAACLFQAWGKVKAKKFYRELRNNGVHIVPGNKQVATGVGQGRFAAGMTDTDDAMGEIRAGRPVRIIFPDQEKLGLKSSGTLFIPNTVALIRGGPNAVAGKKLIDFLLSAEVEAKLAKAESRQIPLNSDVHVTMPDQMKPALSAKKMAVDFFKAARLWDEVQAFLKSEFAK